MGNEAMKADRETQTYNYYCSACNGYVSHNHDKYCSSCGNTHCSYQGHSCNHSKDYELQIRLDKENNVKMHKINEQIEKDNIRKLYEKLKNKIAVDQFICSYCDENLEKTYRPENHRLYFNCDKCNVKHPKCSGCITEEDVKIKEKLNANRTWIYKTTGDIGNDERHLHNILKANEAMKVRTVISNGSAIFVPINQSKEEEVYKDNNYLCCDTSDFIIMIIIIIIIIGIFVDLFLLEKSYIHLMAVDYLVPLIIIILKIVLIIIITLIWLFISLSVEILMDMLFVISIGSISYPHSLWWNTVAFTNMIVNIWNM